VRKRGVYKVLDEYVGWMVGTCKLAPHSLKNDLSVAKKWLRLQGFDISNDLLRGKVEMPRMFIRTVDRAPTPAELRSMILHTNARGKAMLSMLASSGMRIGELLSLRVKDIDFNRSPVTVFLRAEVTKDRQPRYCFLSDEAISFLRNFLGDRISDQEAYLFPTTSRGRKHELGNKPMTYWNADKIFTKAVQNAGLEKKDDYGRDVLHIHTLRKFFFSQLVPALGREVVEALMGHKNFLDASYRRFTMDQMAEQYLKGMGEVTVMLKSPVVSQDRIASEVKHQILLFSDWTEEEIAGLGDLAQYDIEQLRELSEEKRNGTNAAGQKVVPKGELKGWIEKGWEFKAFIDEEAIVALPRRGPQ
jgi:integrase